MALGGARCQPNQPTAPATTGGGTMQVFDRKQLKVDSVPYEQGVLIMGGTPYAINMVKGKPEMPDEVRFLINERKVGTTIEEERYVVTDRILQFAGSRLESFEPPLTLSAFPLRVGSSETWSGTINWQQIKLPATATITVSADPLNLQSGKVDDAVLILVKLQIVEPGGNTADREFKFWVAPDRGILRRDFSAVSSREPEDARPLDE